MQFELSIEAEKDLEDIFDYTYEEFGPVQAFEYVRSFDECFKSITENSRIGIVTGNTGRIKKYNLGKSHNILPHIE